MSVHLYREASWDLPAGFFLKKLLKIILFVAGGIIALLSVLAYEKIIVVDWSVIQHQSNAVAQQGLNTITGALSNTNAQMSAAGLNHIDIIYPIFGCDRLFALFCSGHDKGLSPFFIYLYSIHRFI